MAGPQLSADQRRQEALNVVTPLAAQLHVQGLDLNNWVNNFVSRNTNLNTVGGIRSSAASQFIQQAVRENPSLANRYVEMRTQNLSAADRQFVQDATASATGVNKVAITDQAIQATAGMRQMNATPEERGDVLGMIRAGTPWAAARAQVMRDRAEEQPQQQAVPDVFATSLANMNAQYAAMMRLNAAVQGEIRSVGRRVDRPVEATFGTLAATGTVFAVAGAGLVDAATLGRYHMVSKALDKANTAASAMVGDLSTAINAAHNAGNNWDSVFLQYSNAVSAYRRAADDHDFNGMSQASARIDALKPQLRDAASRVATAAAAGRAASGQVNGVIVSGSIALLANAAGVGMAAGSAGGLTQTLSGTQLFGEVGKSTAKSAVFTAMDAAKTGSQAAAGM